MERVSGQGFGASVLYIDVRQCKGASDLAEEGGLLVVGLDQGEGDVRRPEFNRKTGKSRARPQIGDCSKSSRARLGWTAPSTSLRAGLGGCPHMRTAREQVASREQALAEVPRDHLFRVAESGQVDAGIPANQYIDVRRYTLQLSGRQESRFLFGVRRFRMTNARGLGIMNARAFRNLSGFRTTTARTRGTSSDRDWLAEKGLQQFGDARAIHESRLTIVDGVVVDLCKEMGPRG